MPDETKADSPPSTGEVVAAWARGAELSEQYRVARNAGRLPTTAAHIAPRLDHLHAYCPGGEMPWSCAWLATQALGAIAEQLEVDSSHFEDVKVLADGAFEAGQVVERRRIMLWLLLERNWGTHVRDLAGALLRNEGLESFSDPRWPSPRRSRAGCCRWRISGITRCDFEEGHKGPHSWDFHATQG